MVISMEIRVWKIGILTLLLWGAGTIALAAEPSFCPTDSIIDSLFRFRNLNCPLPKGSRSCPRVVEGDEISLQRALNTVNDKSHAYVSVLFYASWCPFSRAFRPTFSILSSLYPSISHFAFEESSIKPSTLSKYGVRGFPTLLVLSSTTCRQYHGSRTPVSLIDFYTNITGISTASLDGISLDTSGSSSTHEKHDEMEQESCPFPWARSPENLLHQDTCLALATTFVFLRFLFIFLPTLRACFRCAWRRFIQNMRFGSLLEHPLAYLKGVIQLFKSLKEPCKRTNLQGGARNARAWASKSLATVSIGDSNTTCGVPMSDCR